MKRFGIYLCYPPMVALAKEGLGRYLAAFVKVANQSNQGQFVILCPSWMKADLQRLFNSESIAFSDIKIYCPKSQPMIVRLFKIYYQYNVLGNLYSIIFGKYNFFASIKQWVTRPFVKSKQQFIKLGASTILNLFLFSVGILLGRMLFSSHLGFLSMMLLGVMVGVCLIAKFVNRLKIKQTLIYLKNNVETKGYRYVCALETEKMLAIAKKMKVDAWYCPTAFWSSFLELEQPKLLCVPDLFLMEFPINFALLGGERYRQTFQQIKANVANSEYFVTYSEHVKMHALIQHFHLSSDQIFVVRHAPSRLDWIAEFQDKKQLGLSFKEKAKPILKKYLSSSKNEYVQTLSPDFPFLFYASQIRPNKNVLTLLKAYLFLLKERCFSHKLVLTGSSNVLPAVQQFIKKHGLERHVLFFTGLSVQELAASYALADLAVNPSLSEGGCPFTLTEALSVNTPVVMSIIEVTKEIVIEPDLQQAMLFDPYDWRSMAEKIEWALQNRSSLLALQLKKYQQLIQRNWQDVVHEHILALEHISSPAVVGQQREVMNA